VKGLSKKTWVYDTKKGNKLSLNSESKNRTSYNRAVNEYNRRAFQYNYLSPLASIQLTRMMDYLSEGEYFIKHMASAKSLLLPGTDSPATLPLPPMPTISITEVNSQM
jgi:hypothetical protein